MITISLDEYGHFEENTNEPLFIAGLIYDDLEDLKDNIEERRSTSSPNIFGTSILDKYPID